jgi:hypothetical protein
MPTEIRRSSPQIVVHRNAPGVSPFSIATVTAFVILHLVTGVTLARSHTGPAVEASTFATLDDEAKCAAELKQPEPALPYD